MILVNVFAALTGKILGFIRVTLVVPVIVAVTVVEEVLVVVSIGVHAWCLIGRTTGWIDVRGNL